MAKVFEDYFSELQADMVFTCLDYVSDRADTIYIYCSYENRCMASSFFLKINGKLVKRHKVNDMDPSYNITPEMQEVAICTLLEDLKEMVKVFRKFEREPPAEIKMIYDVKKKSLRTAFSYEKKLTEQQIMHEDMEDIWFDSLANQ